MYWGVELVRLTLIANEKTINRVMCKKKKKPTQGGQEILEAM
jgi:hypothetical protein